LDLAPAPEEHTGINLEDIMERTVNMRAGDHLFVSGVVVDGARAALNSATLLATSQNRLWCIAHRLNLVIDDVLSEHGAILTDLRNFIKEVRSSFKLSRALAEAQRQRGVRQPKTLVVNVPTRWCSTHQLCSRYTELYNDMTIAYNNPGSSFGLQPEPEHYVLARVGSTALAPVAALTKRVQRTSFPSIALIPLWLVELERKIAEIAGAARTLSDDRLAVRGRPRGQHQEALRRSVRPRRANFARERLQSGDQHVRRIGW
jgi:hypothetical protein